MFWLLAIMLGFAGGLASFDQYLEPGENVSIINKSFNFTYGGESYSCVVHYFNDQPTFLVCNGDIVTNKSTIQKILYRYGDSMLKQILNNTKQNLTQLILTFNASRFDGDTGFPGKEEQFCRVYLGEVIKDLYYKNPLNQKLYPDIYHYYENYLCGTEIIDCTYNMTLVPELREFFETSYGLDENITIFLELLDRLNIRNYSSQYNKLVDILNSFNQSSQILAQSPFRFDRNCPTCYAVCPIIHTDLQAVAEAKQILGEYYYDEFLLNLPQIIDQIYNNTQYRLGVKNTNIILKTYSTSLNKMNKGFRELKKLYANLTKYLKNKTLTQKFYDFEAWVNNTNKQVNERNITGIEYYINNALTRIPQINQTLISHYKLYEHLQQLKNNLTTAYFLYMNGYPEHLRNNKVIELYNKTLELLVPPINSSDIPIIENNSRTILEEFYKPYNRKRSAYKRYIVELDVIAQPLDRYIDDTNVLKIVLAVVMGAIFASFAFVIGYWIKRAIVGRGGLVVLLPITMLIGIAMAYYTYTVIIPTSPDQVISLLSYLKENGHIVYDDPILEKCVNRFNFSQVYYYNTTSGDCWRNGTRTDCPLYNNILYITLTDKDSSFALYGEPIYKIVYYVNPDEVDECQLARVIN